jgi:REP element-mobilizing transposase RayT
MIKRANLLKPIKGSHRLRKGRYDAPGLYYVLTAVTAGRNPWLENSAAARAVLAGMQWLDENGRIELQSGMVMPDHFHMVAGRKEMPLSAVIHSLKSYSAKRINAAFGRSGVVWQRGYHDHAIRKDEDLNEIIWYCLNNPVRAGLVADFYDYPYWYCRYAV